MIKNLHKGKLIIRERNPLSCMEWKSVTLREKCPNKEFFLVRIWTLFTQCGNLYGNSFIDAGKQPPFLS